MRIGAPDVHATRGAEQGLEGQQFWFLNFLCQWFFCIFFPHGNRKQTGKSHRMMNLGPPCDQSPADRHLRKCTVVQADTWLRGASGPRFRSVVTVAL